MKICTPKNNPLYGNYEQITKQDHACLLLFTSEASDTTDRLTLETVSSKSTLTPSSSTSRPATSRETTSSPEGGGGTGDRRQLQYQHGCTITPPSHHFDREPISIIIMCNGVSFLDILDALVIMCMMKSICLQYMIHVV